MSLDHLLFPIIFGSVITICIVGIHLHKYKNLKDLYKQLVDLDDCPFSFHVDIGNYRDHVIFEFGEAELWVEYKFGIRSDGIYGVKELHLKGINGSDGRDIDLKTGQSIFPIILKMEEFEAWAKTKTFKLFWEADFNSCWQSTLKGIDNLRYLERKSREKDKK